MSTRTHARMHVHVRSTTHGARGRMRCRATRAWRRKHAAPQGRPARSQSDAQTHLIVSLAGCELRNRPPFVESVLEPVIAATRGRRFAFLAGSAAEARVAVLRVHGGGVHAQLQNHRRGDGLRDRHPFRIHFLLTERTCAPAKPARRHDQCVCVRYTRAWCSHVCLYACRRLVVCP